MGSSSPAAICVPRRTPDDGSVISEAKIAEVRQRTDIVEIVGEYVSPLKRAGLNWKGVCPFHADTDPSFNVNPERQFFHCFGCGASGDVFEFVRRIEGLGFVEAVERLAARAGVDLPREASSPAARSAREREREARKRRAMVLEEAASFFEERLRSPAGEPARALLAERGISDETARAFGLGFAPDSWQALLDHLAARRISPREAEEVGLALPRRGGGGHYDRFRRRLVFPVTDPSGRTIAFSGRVLPGGDDEGSAKYVNSPETRDYSKGKVLYGLHQARVHLSKTREAVVVEGNFDVVSLSQAGVGNVVAPLGTALTGDQAALLRNRVDRVTLLFDGDSAGRTAAARAFPILARAGLASYVAPVPAGEDPDSLARSGGRAAVEEVLAARRGLLDEIVRLAAESSDGSAQDVARRIGKLAPYIDALGSPMEKDLYRQRISEAFGIPQTTVFRHLRGRDGAGEKRKTTRERPERAAPGRVAERELIGVLLDQPSLVEEAASSGAIGMISDPRLKSVADELVIRQRRRESSIADLLGGERRDAIAEWLAERAMRRMYETPEKAREAVAEIRERLVAAALGERMREINQSIRTALESGDDGRALELQRQRTEIEREIACAGRVSHRERAGA